jgi:hypothetical protein
MSILPTINHGSQNCGDIAEALLSSTPRRLAVRITLRLLSAVRRAWRIKPVGLNPRVHEVRGFYRGRGGRRGANRGGSAGPGSPSTVDGWRGRRAQWGAAAPGEACVDRDDPTRARGDEAAEAAGARGALERPSGLTRCPRRRGRGPRSGATRPAGRRDSARYRRFGGGPSFGRGR